MSVLCVFFYLSYLFRVIFRFGSNYLMHSCSILFLLENQKKRCIFLQFLKFYFHLISLDIINSIITRISHVWASIKSCVHPRRTLDIIVTSIPICIMDNPRFFDRDVFVWNVQNMIIIF